MAHLMNLDGTPLSWAELHARRDAYYAAARPAEVDEAVKFSLVPEYKCAWPECRRIAINNHWCRDHIDTPRLLRAAEQMLARESLTQAQRAG